MWYEGAIGIPNNGKLTVVRYELKAYEEPSQYGINGGRISKLTLTIKGEVVYNYDRGLDIPPKDENAEKALAVILHGYN